MVRIMKKFVKEFLLVALSDLSAYTLFIRYKLDIKRLEEVLIESRGETDGFVLGDRNRIPCLRVGYKCLACRDNRSDCPWSRSADDPERAVFGARRRILVPLLLTLPSMSRQKRNLH